MPTLAQIEAAIDTKLAALWSAIQTHEASYFAAHGIYWQGLLTHTVYPADGNSTLPDVGSKTPYYETTPWPNAVVTTALPMALRIDQYVTPNGTRGYQATLYVTISGRTWARSQQLGPETYRNVGWRDITVTV